MIMDWLNYHHLLYFWLVVQEGTVARAAERLRLAPSTISSQVATLERSLGHKLFRRSGRRLVLTDVGKATARYAEEIFGLGRELLDVLKGEAVEHPRRMDVGVADVLPKMVTQKLLAPCLAPQAKLHLVCKEGKPEHLLGDLAVHALDVVLSDRPAGPDSGIKVFNHSLGECGLDFFGTRQLVKKHRRGYPRSLEGAPVLLPTPNTVGRWSLDQWFQKRGIRPLVVAEFEDSALLKAVGQSGLGLFAAPNVVAKEICRQYQVQRLGAIDGVREQFYAITGDKRLAHPGVVAMSAVARKDLFGS